MNNRKIDVIAGVIIGAVFAVCLFVVGIKTNTILYTSKEKESYPSDVLLVISDIETGSGAPVAWGGGIYRKITKEDTLGTVKGFKWVTYIDSIPNPNLVFVFLGVEISQEDSAKISTLHGETGNIWGGRSESTSVSIKIFKNGAVSNTIINTGQVYRYSPFVTLSYWTWYQDAKSVLAGRIVLLDTLSPLRLFINDLVPLDETKAEEKDRKIYDKTRVKEKPEK